MLGHGRQMAAIFAAMQNASMNLGMQCLYAPIQHFGEAREFGNIFHGDARLAQQLGCASGGNQLHPERNEFMGEIYESGFVGDTENGALNFRHETSEANEN